MEIRFDFDINDWLALQENYLQNSKLVKRIQLSLFILFPLLLIIMVFQSLKDYEVITLTIAGTLVVLFSFIGIFLIKKLFLKVTLSITKTTINTRIIQTITTIPQQIINNIP